MTAHPKTIVIISDTPYLQLAMTEQLTPQDYITITTLPHWDNIQAPPHLFIVDDKEGRGLHADNMSPVIMIHHPPYNSPNTEDAFVTPFCLQQFLWRARQLLQESPKSAAIRLEDGYIFIPEKHTLRKKDEIIHLTEKEAELLYYLCSASGKIVEKIELLKHIWSYDKEADTHTVETHIYRLRQKMGLASSGADFIVTAQNGYSIKVLF